MGDGNLALLRNFNGFGGFDFLNSASHSYEKRGK